MKKKILVIDDENAIRKSFCLAFEDSDYAVAAAASGEEGLECVRTNPPDLIFLDLKMPGLNGVETLRRIRALGIKVPVYIVTAFYREFMDLLTPAAEEGLRFELMNKPIDSHQIVKIAQSVLEAPSKA